MGGLGWRNRGSRTEIIGARLERKGVSDEEKERGFRMNRTRAKIFRSLYKTLKT